MTHFKLLRLAKTAKKDLQLISNYTKREWGEAQKQKYLSVIQQSFRDLAVSDVSGKSRNDVAKGLYCYSIQKHLIFYRETRNELMILRVIHQRMDVNQHLKQ
ncbi:MAG: type II toxin-antitoxin system RelE/ParE family toxin [Methylophagaceae bacterium]